MPNFKEYNDKIKQLRNMRRVTLAMKMLSTTKLARAQDDLSRASDFINEWKRVTGLAMSVAGALHDPLLEPRKTRESIYLLLITSDTGLCGGFNNNLIRLVDDWLAKNKPSVRILRFSFCGRKGYTFFKDRVEVRSYYEGFTRKPDISQALEIGHEIFDAYFGMKYDEMYVAYNRFVSPMTQEPVIERILPFDPAENAPPAGEAEPLVVLEPQSRRLLAMLLEHRVYHKVYAALLHNAAGEHGARMTAMDNASQNIETLTNSYTLMRNRARQASITTELIEVVSGAEALQ